MQTRRGKVVSQQGKKKGKKKEKKASIPFRKKARRGKVATAVPGDKTKTCQGV